MLSFNNCVKRFVLFKDIALCELCNIIVWYLVVL